LIATAYETVPLPVPLAPVRIVIHGALLIAVHEHSVPAVTATVPPPARGPCVLDVGLIVNVQPDAWLIVNVCPAIVSVP
jgi:hypothetical protein